MFRDGDTIAARATPLGPGALAIIRVSGPATWALAAKLFRGRAAARPRLSRLGELFHAATGEALDRAVLTLYRAPRSYTGEDMAELTTHAGPAVVAAALDALYAAGARAAEPGEFTWRAVANGKLDLAEAAAVADLSAARTAAARGDALRRLQGELSAGVAALREKLVAARALVEAALEFEQEVAAEEVLALVREAEAASRKLVGRSRDREALFDGTKVALAGPRNAGKSTLFNRLLGEERAIVTPKAGTTTDRLEAPYLARGVLFRLSDGAGLDDNGASGDDDDVEREGVRRARAFLDEAAVVIWLDDASRPPPDNAPPVAAGKLIRAANKCDVPLAAGWEEALAANAGIVRISAKTGAGVDALVERLVARAAACAGASDDDALSLSSRERRLLGEAAAALARAGDIISAHGGNELAAEELRLAGDALARVVGPADIDEVYGEVFSRFCVGK